jgi:hypothetical protein
LVNVLSPTTAHYIMLDFRKWRRMREIMLKRLEAKTIRISATKDEGDMKALFSEAAMETLLHLREGTAIGRKCVASRSWKNASLAIHYEMLRELVLLHVRTMSCFELQKRAASDAF